MEVGEIVQFGAEFGEPIPVNEVGEVVEFTAAVGEILEGREQ
jgi:hypothetical protein